MGSTCGMLLAFTAIKLSPKAQKVKGVKAQNFRL